MRDAQGLAQSIVDLMKRPTARDLQVRIGPSNLGDPCDRCLGLALAGKLDTTGPMPPDRFNLMAWVGTAVHRRFETDIAAEEWPDVFQEYKVDVGKIKGYGRVTGHTDLYSRPHRTVLDFKMRNKASIKLWRAANEIKQDSRVQGHVYGYGLERKGLPVEEVCILFVPRDSMLDSDIWAFTEPYDKSIAKAAIKRAEDLWANYVKPGKVELLKTHRDCYNCSAYVRNVTFKEEQARG